MKTRLAMTPTLVAITAAGAMAQGGPSLFANGGMDVQEGGTVSVLGRVIETPNGAQGRFTVNFDTGVLRKVWMESFEDFFANFFTGALSGKCYANVFRNGTLERVAGYCVVMMDDVDILESDLPDEFFLQFVVDKTGDVIVRNGKMTRGDIRIDLNR